MRVNIDFDTTNAEDLAALQLIFASGGAEPAKPAKKPKPTVPVAGNPDAPATGATTAEATADKTDRSGTLAAKVEAAAVPAVITLRADAPAEVTAILTKTDRESIANAVLRAVKPIAEGGVTRAVVVPKLEKLAGVEPGTAVKLGMVPDAKLEEVRQFILSQYKAAA